MVRLFRVFVPVGSLALLISEVVLVTSAFVVAVTSSLEYDPTVYPALRQRVLPHPAGHGQRHHGPAFPRSLYQYLRQVAHAAAAAAQPGDGGRVPGPGPDQLCQPRSAHADPSHGAGQRPGHVGIFGWRSFIRSTCCGVVGAQRILFVGGNPVVEAIASTSRSIRNWAWRWSATWTTASRRARRRRQGAGTLAALRDIATGGGARQDRGGHDRAAQSHARGRPARTAFLRHLHRGGQHHLRIGVHAHLDAGIAAVAIGFFRRTGTAPRNPAAPGLLQSGAGADRNHRFRRRSCCYRHRREAHLAGTGALPPDARGSG